MKVPSADDERKVESNVADDLAKFADENTLSFDVDENPRSFRIRREASSVFRYLGLAAATPIVGNQVPSCQLSSDTTTTITTTRDLLGYIVLAI